MNDEQRYRFLQKDLCVKFYSVDSGHVRPIVCAFERTSPRKYPIGPWELTNYVVHFIFDGEGFCTYKNTRSIIEKGSVFAIAPGKTVSYMQNPENPWRSVWFEIIGADCASLFERAGLGDEVFIGKVSDPEKFKELFFTLMNDCNENADADGFIFLSDVYRIFAALREEFAMKSAGEEVRSQLVDDIIQYIDDNYGTDISAGSVAKQFFISPQYLARLFKRHVKTTPSEYITDVRLGKAVNMLINGNFSIQTISELTGFSNQYYFSTVFKKKYFVSPVRFRSMQKKQREDK